MCGRKSLTKSKTEIIEEYLVDEWDTSFPYFPSYNIAPTNISPILIHAKKRIIKPMHWGLIPHWAKDKKFAAKMINARQETLTSKPAYKNLTKQHRCIVIADGYFEWKQINGAKQPYFIHRPDKSFLSIAGLWSLWKDPNDNPLYSYTVITTTPQEEIAHIHNRMPAILPQNKIDIWLDHRKYSHREALPMLQPGREKLEYYPVSSIVNSPVNNSPECIKKIEDAHLSLF